MDDLFKRGCLASVGMSLGIFFVAIAMTENGSAVASNPAWHFVSFLRDIFLWPWVLLLAAGVIIILVTIVNAIYHKILEILERSRVEIEPTRPETVKIAVQNFEILKPLPDMNTEKIARVEAVDPEREKQRKIAQEIERKKKRSSEDAVEEALDDF